MDRGLTWLPRAGCSSRPRRAMVSACLRSPQRDLTELSAATTRWRVCRSPSPPNTRRWTVELLRLQGSAARHPHAGVWTVERDDATRALYLAADVLDRPGQAALMRRMSGEQASDQLAVDAAVILTRAVASRELVARLCSIAHDAGAAEGMDLAATRGRFSRRERRCTPRRTGQTTTRRPCARWRAGRCVFLHWPRRCARRPVYRHHRHGTLAQG